MNKSCIQNLLICVVLLSGISCKKEKDETGPVVTFNTPFDNQYFNVYDQIQVSADITDETAITSVTLSLVNSNYIPVNSSMSLTVATSPKAHVSATYLLNNIHLESGFYYLSMVASDGKNVSSTYRRINIAAVPKALKKVFVATAVSPYQTNLYCIDSTFGSMNFYKTFTGDCTGISSSSYYQQVFVCSYYYGAYSGINLKDNSVKFSLASTALSGVPYFTAYYSEDKNNYVARYDETIKGYDYNGNITYNASANAGYYVRKMTMNNGFLIAEEKQKSSPSKVLVSYYSTGYAEQQKAINQDVVAFCEKGENNVFVFGNLSGQGIIQLYDRLNNNLSNPYPYSLATGTILSAVKIDMNTYLIGHSNGTIYKYQYQTSGVTPYLTGYTAVQIKYDELNNNLYIAELNKLTSVNYSSKTVVNTFISTENIADICLLYNR
jgi:hypothetical protein